MPDRRRLAAAASALVASFAVVLAVGAFTGGSPSHHAAAGAVRLTVSVTSARHDLAGGPVSVLRARSLAQAASGRLSPAGVLQVSVAEGAYFVCVHPPGGWRVADPAVMQLPGWSCLGRVLRAGRALVTFRLTSAAARTQVSNP